MSRYLIDRIAACSNVDVICDTEVVEPSGTADQGLQRVRWRNAAREPRSSRPSRICSSSPAPTRPRRGSPDAASPGRQRLHPNRRGRASPERVLLPLETGVVGIFAIGDVRSGSVKRVGAAIGEGAAVVAQLHTFLARRGSLQRLRPAWSRIRHGSSQYRLDLVIE